jgi:hypothetical protein
MSGAHHATIAGLVARVRELEGQNAELGEDIVGLQDALDEAFVLPPDTPPALMFDALRHQLTGWSGSDWRRLGRLIAFHVDGRLETHRRTKPCG